MKYFILTLSAVLLPIILFAQTIKLDKNNLLPNQVYISFEKMGGKNVLEVVKDSTVIPVDEPTFVKIKDMNFKNGVIEVKVLSRLLKNAPAYDL